MRREIETIKMRDVIMVNVVQHLKFKEVGHIKKREKIEVDESTSKRVGRVGCVGRAARRRG